MCFEGFVCLFVARAHIGLLIQTGGEREKFIIVPWIYKLTFFKTVRMPFMLNKLLGTKKPV